jgi:hypothetical protein
MEPKPMSIDWRRLEVAIVKIARDYHMHLDEQSGTGDKIIRLPRETLNLTIFAKDLEKELKE